MIIGFKAQKFKQKTATKKMDTEFGRIDFMFLAMATTVSRHCYLVTSDCVIVGKTFASL